MVTFWGKFAAWPHRSDVVNKLKLIDFDDCLTLNASYGALKEWLRLWENLWLGDRTDVFNQFKLSCVLMCAHAHVLCQESGVH